MQGADPEDSCLISLRSPWILITTFPGVRKTAIHARFFGLAGHQQACFSPTGLYMYMLTRRHPTPTSHMHGAGVDVVVLRLRNAHAHLLSIYWTKNFRHTNIFCPNMNWQDAKIYVLEAKKWTAICRGHFHRVGGEREGCMVLEMKKTADVIFERPLLKSMLIGKTYVTYTERAMYPRRYVSDHSDSCNKTTSYEWPVNHVGMAIKAMLPVNIVH